MYAVLVIRCEMDTVASIGSAKCSTPRSPRGGREVNVLKLLDFFLRAEFVRILEFFGYFSSLL